MALPPFIPSIGGNAPYIWLLSSDPFGHANNSALVTIPVDGQPLVAGSPVAIWTPASGKRFNVIGFYIQLGLSGNALKILDGATLKFIKPGANSANDTPMPVYWPYTSTAINNVLQFDMEGANTTALGTIWGYESL